MVVTPAEMPVPTPVDDTVPTAELLLLQTPPGVIQLSPVVEPTQTVSVPVIGAGFGLTIIVTVTEQPPGSV